MTFTVVASPKAGEAPVLQFEHVTSVTATTDSYVLHHASGKADSVAIAMYTLTIG